MSVARELAGRVVVVSPHLDDAALSLGGSIARAARRGAAVDVLTVFAGDPSSDAHAGRWDAAAGFLTEGAATTWRRAEDRRACEILGARPVWLSFGERHYERRGDDTAILEAILERVAGVDAVVLPGSPLVHPDHALVAELVLSADLPVGAVGVYEEQPYCSPRWARRQRRRGRSVTGTALLGLPSFERMPLGLRDRRARWSAVGADRSQLKLLDSRLGQVLLRLGPESLAWLPRYGGRCT